MKNTKTFITLVLLMLTCSISAQEVNTLYFLENAPMRHLVNPAFQPVSKGYLNFTPLGYTSFWVGNNSLTMSDAIYRDPQTGRTITALYSFDTTKKLASTFRRNTLANTQLTINLLGFGFRVKEKGYVNINILEHIDGGTNIPSTLPLFLLDGGMKNPRGENLFSLARLGVFSTVYTEIGGGYSHKINDEWTVGGKLKLLIGQANLGLNSKDLGINASMEQWKIAGSADVLLAGPVNWANIPTNAKAEDIYRAIAKTQFDIKTLLKPAGYGAAVDLGFAYKPHPQVQITAALNDLGFIYWNNGRKYTASVDTVFTGAGTYTVKQLSGKEGAFNGDTLLNDALRTLETIAESARFGAANNGFARMINARLNVGVDANFWNNRIGIGVVSQTRLIDSKFYEEVTFGAALRPTNWFNLAVSYSLLQNGKYSNIGAGLSIMPYDGINMTLAVDYIPTSYTNLPGKNTPYIIPYKSKGVNLALGFSIVWGSNDKDSDKDGIKDQFDMCPRTPKNVSVDKLGCPIDSDGDGVPDYLDQCPNTPSKAYGLVDEFGCELDTDGDGVPDYKDECPDTPEAARGFIDEKGCEKDTDGDGIYDYLDECPDTPAEAKGMTDEKGCPLDTDGDGVPDYLDECPDTPEAAFKYIDAHGCPLDTDGDGVPDYLDECPNTPEAARGFVDEKGCEKDTDGDGVHDYKDECPTIAGVAYNKGCPEVKKEIRSLLKKAMQGIQFETGKATILKKSYPLLDQIAGIFIENSNYIIEVQGHTDNVGKAELNKKLSDERAHSVMDYLVKAGVPAERMSAHGYGMDVPIADNKTKAGRAENRRVEFNITFEEVTYETILDHVDSTLYQQHLDSIQPQNIEEQIND